MSTRSLTTLALVIAAFGGTVIGLVFSSNPPMIFLGVSVTSLVLGMWLANRTAGPVRELTLVARQWANGEFSTRPPLSLSHEAGDLADAMRALGDRLSGRERMLGDEQELRAVIMEAASEGILAVDRRRRVIWMNVAARRMLGTTPEVPFPLDQVARPLWNSTVIESALEGDAEEAAEFQLGQRVLAVAARSLGERGAVVTLFELTRIRRLESMRRDFVANVSHELKTPLTSIRGFADTLLTDGDMPVALQRSFLTTLIANAERMQRLIDELLDLSRIESGTWTPRTQQIAIAQLADDVLQLVHDRARTKGVTLCNEISRSDVLAADPTAIRQILTNLVENAVRHSPERGVVTLGLNASEHRWCVTVRDTGAGISPEHVARIFERFYRVDAGRTRDQGGNGLGLAIVKHLAEAHGGSASAESVLGLGTTVTVVLPRIQPEPAVHDHAAMAGRTLSS